MPAKMWRHSMLSFLEQLKDRLPDSQNDLRYKLNFMELAYTMIDLLHQVNPEFQDMWIKCLVDFIHQLKDIRNNYENADVWTIIARRWYSDLSDKISTVLSYIPKVYVKSSSFIRKAIRISLNGKEYLARPDSGSEKDVCSEEFAHKHGYYISRNDKDKVLFKLGTKTEVRSIGRMRVSCGLAAGTNILEERWFYVLKKCIAPVIIGEQFIKKISLYRKNKHLLVRCPDWFTAEGCALNGLADAGSDEGFMSLECATRNGFKIDRCQRTRMMIQQADGSLVKTVGQARVSVKIGLTKEFEMNFHVLPDLSCDTIFCEEFLEQTDGFNNFVGSPHVPKGFGAEFQELPYTLNTLINLGPINAFANRSRTVVAEDTPEQEHDNAIVDEIYRRNKANRTIRRISDQNEHQIAEEAEARTLNAFDLNHANCAICIQRSNDGPSGG